MNGCDRRQPINAQDIRKELAGVRDKVNTLVDKLDAVTLKDDKITHQADNAPIVPETETNYNTVSTAVVTEAISVFDPLKPSADYSPVVTTTAATTQLPTTTTNFVPVSSTGSASHLFTGQSSSFLESSPGVQYIPQPTAPPPSSTPQPTQPNTYPPQPPPNVGQTANTHYTGGGGNNAYPYTSQYQQPTASHYPPQPQGGQTSQPPTASYAPYAAPPASMYQGNTYVPPGQPPPASAGRGYTPAGPPRNSPYRIGY